MLKANRLREMLPNLRDEWRVVGRRPTKSLGDFCRKEPRSGRVGNYFQHPFLDTNLLLTDGCAYLRKEAQCYWLFDIVAQQLVKRSDFIVKLKQSKKGPWYFTAKDSRNEQTFYTQKIPYSDFPLSEITIWVENGVALLPSEH